MDFAHYWELVQAWVLWLWSFWEVKVLVSHVLLNTALALAVSIVAREFQLKKLAEFLYFKILPLTIAFGAFALFAAALGLKELTVVIWALLETRLLADTLDSLARLGVPIPDAFKK